MGRFVTNWNGLGAIPTWLCFILFCQWRRSWSKQSTKKDGQHRTLRHENCVKSSWFSLYQDCACVSGRVGEGGSKGGTNQWQQLAFDWTGNQCGWWGGAEQIAQEGSQSFSFVSLWLKLSVKCISDDKQKADSKCETEMSSTPLHPHASMSNARGRWDSWCAINSRYWVVWARRAHKSGLIR